MTDLLETSTLEITEGSVGGYNADGNWVETIPGQKRNILCNIQPYRQRGRERTVLPEGASVDDVLVVYTRAKVNTSEDRQEPDTTMISGKLYYAWRRKDWQFTYGADIEHDEIYFVLRRTER